MPKTRLALAADYTSRALQDAIYTASGRSIYKPETVTRIQKNDPELAWIDGNNHDPELNAVTDRLTAGRRVLTRRDLDTSAEEWRNALDAYYEDFDLMVSMLKKQPAPTVDRALGGGDGPLKLIQRCVAINGEWGATASTEAQPRRKNHHIDKAWGVTVAGLLDGILWRDSQQISAMVPLASGTSAVMIHCSPHGTPLRPQSIPHELGHAVYHNYVVSQRSPLASTTGMISATAHEAAAILSEMTLWGWERQLGQKLTDRKTCAKPDMLLHIALRMEIEAKLFDGSLQARTVPAYWNSKCQEWFDITIEHPREGWLSDAHWSMGLFGYYPAYALGYLKAIEMYLALPEVKVSPRAHEAAVVLVGPLLDAYNQHLNFDHQSQELFTQLFPDPAKTAETYRTWLDQEHHL